MMFAIVLDVVLIVILAVAIGFAFVVNRKLDSLRTAGAEMDRLAAAFAESTARTEEGLSRLKVAARTTEEDRQRTEKLVDDLRYLIERGDGLADRLEVAVKAARSSERSIDPPVERPAPRRTRPVVKAAEHWGEREERETPPRSRAERQLLDALRASGLAGAGAGGPAPTGR